MDSAAELGQCRYEGEGLGRSFNEKAVRLAFIRKVYGILSVQLLITFGFICIFAIPDSVRKWSQQNTWVLIALLNLLNFI